MSRTDTLFELYRTVSTYQEQTHCLSFTEQFQHIQNRLCLTNSQTQGARPMC